MKAGDLWKERMKSEGLGKIIWRLKRAGCRPLGGVVGSHYFGGEPFSNTEVEFGVKRLKNGKASNGMMYLSNK